MPFIHIKSLPFAESFDASAVLESVSRDVARETKIELRHIHATWEFLEPGHYVVAGKAHTRQSASSHPLLVDLLTPDFKEPAAIAVMLEAVASSLAERTSMPRHNIFINHRQARSGAVFDAGKVERW